MKALYVLIFVFYGCAQEASQNAPANESNAKISEAKPALQKDNEEADDKDVLPPEELIIPMQANEWIDPITELRWMLGGEVSYELSRNACGKKYRLPTEDEAKQAIANSILDIAKDMGRGEQFWVDTEGGYTYAADIYGQPYRRDVQGISTLFCIRR